MYILVSICFIELIYVILIKYLLQKWGNSDINFLILYYNEKQLNSYKSLPMKLQMGDCQRKLPRWEAECEGQKA